MMDSVHHFLIFIAFLGIFTIISAEAEIIQGAGEAEQKNDLRKYHHHHKISVHFM